MDEFIRKQFKRSFNKYDILSHRTLLLELINRIPIAERKCIIDERTDRYMFMIKYK